MDSARSKDVNIVTFFIIAYSISRAAWIALFERHLSHLVGSGRWLYLTAVFAPHASALVNTAINGGPAGVHAFYRLFRRRVPLRWGIVAIFVPPIVHLMHAAIALILHLPHDSFFHRPPRTLAVLILGRLAVVFGEEPGWRGFALPRLIKRFGPNIATLILGIAWASWHMPLFVVAGTPQYGSPFLPFAVMLVTWSMVMTLVVIRAQGSVVPAMLFHASANLCAFTMWEPDVFVLALGPWVVAAGIAAWLTRRNGAPIPQRAFD